MALQSISNVKISGISACVPKFKESNVNSPLFQSAEDAQRFIDNTGVEERRIASEAICSSDLCFHAAEKLIAEIGWDKSEIDCLVFITQTPDYIVPATSCGLQHRLGLSEECHTFDVTLGCSAWVYGLSIIGSLLSSGWMKKGLLLVGETTSKTKSKTDKTTYPLFGDAGTATLLEYSPESPAIKMHSGTDGSKQLSIYIPDGGFRSPVTKESLEMVEVEPGLTRNRLQYIMDGAQVFTFTISKVPKSIKKLIENFEIDQDQVDYFLLHQANKMIVDKIAGKFKLPPEKVPGTLKLYGNTSCSSIPLTIVSELNKQVRNKHLRLIASGFGSGLSLASAYFELDKIVCPELFEIE